MLEELSSIMSKKCLKHARRDYFKRQNRYLYRITFLGDFKYRVEVTTHAAYSFAVKTRIVPYFQEKKTLLADLTPKHLHDFYQYCLKKYKITTNTVQHYHANIRQALQHAFKMDMIRSNPADKVDRPKKNQFVGSFYTNEELNQLFEAVKEDPVELAVYLAAFYGLRRSEIVGLKWSAINFQLQTISIRHTVIPVSYEGKQIIVEKDRANNKASYRTLPLVPVFFELCFDFGRNSTNTVPYSRTRINTDMRITFT
ncbi:tyrosine-type recombinase/integrase [Paenibacillus elgii]|uniref:tyrosine-type recombinase/integrase n=1 Tax=Paenibacillus elgii TaxID=189691 RepID=UPI00192C5A95|nr:phage integrase SAM-like domain-containing protein [Paenibacillus elgii]